jgi:hypothetical protein
MWHADRHRFLSSRGALTAVRSSAASAGDKQAALRPLDAGGVVRRMAETSMGDRQPLMDLAGCLPSLSSFTGHHVPVAMLVDRLVEAAERGTLLLVPGWGMGADGAAAESPKAPGGRLRGRDLPFEGRVYRIVAPSGFVRGGDYHLVRADQAGAILDRMMAAPGLKPADRAALAEVVNVLGRDLLLLRKSEEQSLPASRVAEPAATPSQLAKAGAPKRHELLFKYVSNTGHPIVDDEGFELLKPDGGTESGTLSNGRLERRDVEPGTYELRAKFIKGARWSVSEAHPFEEVQLIVEAKGIPDGAKVECAVRHALGAPDAEPLATLSGDVVADAVSIPWKYDQPVGAPCFEQVTFEAVIGKKRAVSGILRIEPHDISAPRGLQERLRALGYDPGAPTDTIEAPTTGAVMSYQEDHPPLEVTGELDEWTMRMLDEHLT